MSWPLHSLLPPLLRSARPAKVGSAADRIRSVKNRPSLLVCAFSAQRHADLWVSSCSLLNSRRDRFVFFCLQLLCHFRFAPFASPDNSFRFQAHTQHPFPFRILQLSDVGRTVTVLNCVLKFFARFPQDKFTEQPVGCTLSLLRYVDSTMNVRVVDWWISVSNLHLAALIF